LHKKTPFYESASFWGTAPLAVSAVLAVLAVRMNNLSIFFVLAWAFGVPPAIIVCRGITTRWRRYGSTLILLVALGALLYWLDVVTKPNETKIEYVISWNNPKPIDTQTPLSKRELNAEAFSKGERIDGEFVYDPTFGATLPTGRQTLRVAFTPRDNVTYRQAEKTVVIEVRPVTPISGSNISRPQAFPTPINAAGSRSAGDKLRSKDGCPANSPAEGPLTQKDVPLLSVTATPLMLAPTRNDPPALVPGYVSAQINPDIRRELSATPGLWWHIKIKSPIPLALVSADPEKNHDITYVKEVDAGRISDRAMVYLRMKPKSIDAFLKETKYLRLTLTADNGQCFEQNLIINKVNF
jgi:hypothetical protein